MNRETIEKVAKEYAEENMWYPGDIYNDSDIREMEKVYAEFYTAGAQWRINSVWHDAKKEVPEPFRPLLLAYEDGTFIGKPKGSLLEMCPSEWKIWAYIRDLLPDRKEDEQ